MKSDLERHQLAYARERAGICSVCTQPHADCDCIVEGNSKTRRLREAQLSPTVQTNHVGTETETALADLEARVTKMRDLGVTRWGDIELGPAPPPPSDDGAEDVTQRLTAAEAEKRAREERRRISMASSGGPLKRLADD